MPLQLTQAQQELLLLHILTTTSSTIYNPDNDQFHSGDDILNQIVRDFNVAGMPFNKRLTWAGLTPLVASQTASRAWAVSSSFSDVSSKVFQPTAATGSLWGGPSASAHRRCHVHARHNSLKVNLAKFAGGMQ